MPFENPKPRYDDKNLPKENIESMHKKHQEHQVRLKQIIN